MILLLWGWKYRYQYFFNPYEYAQRDCPTPTGEICWALVASAPLTTVSLKYQRRCRRPCSMSQCTFRNRVPLVFIGAGTTWSVLTLSPKVCRIALSSQDPVPSFRFTFCGLQNLKKLSEWIRQIFQESFF